MKKLKNTLKDLNISIKKGSLVGVVGSVGAGKSSLCSAILGEMKKVSGTVIVNVSSFDLFLNKLCSDLNPIFSGFHCLCAPASLDSKCDSQRQYFIWKILQRMQIQ